MRIFFSLSFLLFINFCLAQNAITVKDENGVQGRGIYEGIDVVGSAAVTYQKNSKKKFNIRFGEPVVVAVADKPFGWGFFQFPVIDRTSDGEIIARWNLAHDAMEAYGTEARGMKASADNGKSWSPDKKPDPGGSVLLPNGDRLSVYTPKPVPVKALKLPAPAGIGVENYRKSNFTFYRLHDLPEQRQGVYFKRLKKGETEWKIEHAALVDPDAARYSLAGMMPIVWWGDIKIAKDKSLIAGIYPGFLIDKSGKTDPRSGAFFYRSTDNGHTWKIQGRIPFQLDTQGDSVSLKRMGYTEPAFEILTDGTFLCILRTTDGAGIGPMYGSYSRDMGKTWTRPTITTAAGVLPRLLQLKNGVLVMSSGRPGVQLRFATDKKGLQWTRAFEMLPLQNDFKKELNGGTAQISCGYTGLLELASNKFLIIYSDFNYKTTDGSIRKAIKVREVEVNK